MPEMKADFRRLAAAAAALVFLLAGCGAARKDAANAEPGKEAAVVFAAGAVDAAAAELSIPLARGETALLAQMTALRSADLSGSEDEAEVAAWAKAHPETETLFTVTLPDGTILDSGTRSYDMSGLSAEEAERCAACLALLPDLRTLKLGGEGGAIGWGTLEKLRALLPETSFRYAFTLYGKDCDLSNTSLNLSHIPIDDGGKALRRAMSLMPALRYVDLDTCGLSNAELETLRGDYPDVKLVWRVWFGENYSVRTDVQRILASKPSAGGMLYPWDVEALSCCHDVVFLDLGHNKGLTDISFVAQMPKLEVAILAMCDWTDASPLAQCPELEYLEMQTTLCGDLSPLSGLQNLRHLNIAGNVEISDITPLYSLTGLKRLWLGSMNRVPNEQCDEFRRRVPDCEFDMMVYTDPTGGTWRWDGEGNIVERYYLLRMQFGYYEDSVYSFKWNDKLY